MLKIGDFSKLSRISIRMLRHYDDLGLLVPKSTDRFTSYRYYCEDQLPVAGRIIALKNMGFGLSTVAEILKSYDDPQALSQFLAIKQVEVQEQVEETNQHLMTETADMNLQSADNCYSLAVFHDEGYKESDVDVEIQIIVKGNYKNTENVVFKTVPAIEIASATYKGSYEQLTTVNNAVANWVNDNGFEFNGAMFCIYHVSPAQTKNLDELVTEVCYPVKKK